MAHARTIVYASNYFQFYIKCDMTARTSSRYFATNLVSISFEYTSKIVNISPGSYACEKSTGFNSACIL